MVNALDLQLPDSLLRLFEKHGGWLRQQDVIAAGYHPRWLSRLVEIEAIERVRKGLYRLAGDPTSSHQSLIDAGRAVPEGVVCLLSALAYYELTTANPPEVYLAIARKARVPLVSYPPIRFFRFSDPQLKHEALDVQMNYGVYRQVHGKGQSFKAVGPIRIFDEEKTLCDCLRHRTVVGQDVAVEALRLYLRRKNKNIERLVKVSHRCRVEHRLRAYLEALL